MKRIAPLLLLALLAAGCGHKTGAKNLAQTTSTGSEATAVQILQLEAAPGALRFNVKILKSVSTHVELVMTNGSTIQHDIAIKGHGVDKKGAIVGQGKKSTVTATLKPGTYVFYCSVDGHEAAGMRGQLIVGAPA